MKISIIIPTYNAEKYLSSLLHKLKHQTVSLELIIIDSSSTDNTLAIAQKYTDKILTIPQSEFDHGGTRTKAAKISSGDIIIFLTQDALPCDNQSIKKMLKAFKNPHIGAAYGRQIPYKTTSIFGKHLRKFNYPDKSYKRTLNHKEKYGLKTAFLSDSFAAYKRTALEDINWFKDGLIVGEDSYAGAKLILKGYALAYIANAKVYHSHSYTPIEEFKRYFDIGVFHQKEHWLLDNFGTAEGEGFRYIKSELNYLVKLKAYYLIPEFFLRNGLKYLGYKLGKQYKALPLNLTKKLTMHTSWWERYYKK